MNVENGTGKGHCCALAQRADGVRRKLTMGGNVHRPQWETREMLPFLLPIKLKGGREHLKSVFHVLTKNKK